METAEDDVPCVLPKKVPILLKLAPSEIMLIQF
jgi:hypothetical protein